MPVAGAATQALLDWTPDHPTLLEDLRAAGYFTPEAFERTEGVWSPDHGSRRHSRS